MVIIGGETRIVSTEHRMLAEMPADEVFPRALIRDQESFRQIARVVPSVVELSLVWFSDPVEGCADQLTLPSLVSVSLRRVCDVQ